jgi:N-acetylneuraminic acid mutarotase
MPNFQANKMHPMKYCRIETCCIINDETDQIFVLGGVTNDNDTPFCEKLDIAKNKWTQLPSLNEAKNSISALILNGRRLYVFGGACGENREIDLTHQTVSIEVLDLYPKFKENFMWDLLEVRLQMPLWGIGTLALSKDKIMLFGGTDGNCESQDVFVLAVKEEEGKETLHELNRLKTRLVKPDWFYNFDIGTKDGREEGMLHILGERKVHVFDLKRFEFTECIDFDVDDSSNKIDDSKKEIQEESVMSNDP